VRWSSRVFAHVVLGVVRPRLRQPSLKHYRPSDLVQSIFCTLERLQLLCDTFTAHRGANAWRIPPNAGGGLLSRFRSMSLAPATVVEVEVVALPAPSIDTPPTAGGRSLRTFVQEHPVPDGRPALQPLS
jgi:hypothetical protein